MLSLTSVIFLYRIKTKTLLINIEGLDERAEIIFLEINYQQSKTEIKIIYIKRCKFFYIPLMKVSLSCVGIEVTADLVPA